MASSGLLAAVAAFLAWGVFPLYWRQLEAVPALDIMMHRLVWCFVFVWAYLAIRKGWGWWSPLLQQRRLLALLSLSGLIIGGNWYLYIWAVNSGHIVETSLGYFINPLVNVLLGVIFLGERLGKVRWFAVALAACGVAWMTWQLGQPPWIALGLAFSFASYGLIRKIADVDAIPGLALESALLLPFALVYLGYFSTWGKFGFLQAGASLQFLLILGGVVTALPLIWFAYGARRLPYATVGILQYLAPSIQLVIGVMVFHEPFGRDRLLGFFCIWLGLLIYAVDGLVRYQRQRRNTKLAANDTVFERV